MIKATPSDKQLVIKILTDSFESNQSVNYIVKQDKQRLERIGALMDYSFEVCMEFGDVWLSNNRKACALVLYPQKKRTTLKAILLDVKLILKAIGISNIKKALDRESRIKARQLKAPASYLWFIGVIPQDQHAGIGSDLLTQVLADADKQGLPVILETSTMKNLPWYERFGFSVYDQLDLGYHLYFLKHETGKL